MSQTPPLGSGHDHIDPVGSPAGTDGPLAPIRRINRPALGCCSPVSYCTISPDVRTAREPNVSREPGQGPHLVKNRSASGLTTYSLNPPSTASPRTCMPAALMRFSTSWAYGFWPATTCMGTSRVTALLTRSKKCFSVALQPTTRIFVMLLRWARRHSR